MSLRDHEPIVLEEFNGLWRRGDEDSVPDDHFASCNNIQFIESGFETRDGLDTLIAQGNVLRMYNYKLQNGESLIILDVNGSIYHSLLDGSNTTYGPILTIPEMTDFGFQAYNGRAYITPFTTETDLNGVEYQRGLEDEFLYVYKGDGTPARPAGGDPPVLPVTDTPMLAYNSPLRGTVDIGIHVLAVTYSDGADDSTGLGPTVLPVIYAPGNQEVIVDNIPVTVVVGVTERRIWSTRAIDPADWTGNPGDYTFYLAATIPDPSTTTSAIINYSDATLVTAFVAGTLPNPTSGGMVATQSATDGYCDLGLHIIGVVYETDTGYLTAPGPQVLAVQTFVNVNKAIDVSNIPISPDSFVTKRHLIASKAITNYNGDDLGYQLYFIPSGTINDNTSTTATVSFYDIDLLDDASHLIDNFADIPAGVTLTLFHGRMVLTTPHDDISIAYLSAPGEPEAFDQVDGILIMDPDGNPITNAQEFRDVLYTFKKTRTKAWTDNGDVPSTWTGFILDQGIGASVHGIALVLDSGGVNIDFLLIVDFSGIMVFNGAYSRPELTWKIQDLWYDIDRNAFANIQILNASLTQVLYTTLPDKTILVGDYKNGLNAKDIRWTPWTFDIETTTIALYNTNTLAIGAEQSIP